MVRPEAATCAGPGPLAGQPLLSMPLLDSSCGECRQDPKALSSLYQGPGQEGPGKGACGQTVLAGSDRPLWGGWAAGGMAWGLGSAASLQGWQEEVAWDLCLPVTGEDYVACLPDNSSGTMAMVAFSAAHEGPLVPESCSAFCFSAGHGLAALLEQGQCLCGAAQAPNTSTACQSVCSSPPPLPTPTPNCKVPTLLQHIFPASPGATLVVPHGPLASGQPAAFHITAPLPISFTCWDFGDGSPKVDVAGPATTHRYVLPGHYHVTAVLALGSGSALLSTEVQVEAAPAALKLVCPASVLSDESLHFSIQNRGGSALQASYSILALGEEPSQGGCLPHWAWVTPAASSFPSLGTC